MILTVSVSEESWCVVLLTHEFGRLLTWQKARINEQDFGVINKKKRQVATREQPPYSTKRGGEVVSGVLACIPDIWVCE